MSESLRRTDTTRRYVPPVAVPRPFRTNVMVAVTLSAVAGALNAGGFFAVGVYTSHVTGSWSRMADEAALGHFLLAVRFASFVAAFVLGAAASTLLIEHNPLTARRVRFLKPLVLEIVLLAAFVALGAFLESPAHPIAKYMTLLLSFTMGLQNAMVTKISGSVVRTTHMTGISTDFGIEVARLSLFVRERWRARRSDLERLPPPHPPLGAFARETAEHLRREGQKAALLAAILVSFALGATGGALSFLRWGYLGAAPIALVLASLVALELFLIRTDRAEGLLTGPSTLRLEARALAATENARPAAPPATPLATPLAAGPLAETPAAPPPPASEPVSGALPGAPPLPLTEGRVRTARRFRLSGIEEPPAAPPPPAPAGEGGPP